MLRELVEYARKQSLEAEPGFKPKQVRWALTFAQDGSFTGVVELGTDDQKGKKGQWFSKCPDLSQGELTARSVIRSHFLVASADNITLYGNPEDDIHRLSGNIRVGMTSRDLPPKGSADRDVVEAIAKQRWFVHMLREASKGLPQLAAVADSLSRSDVLEQVRRKLGALKAKAADLATIRVGSQYPVESDAWHDWWREFRRCLRESHPDASRASKSAASGAMRCFLTGELVEPARTHPKITGLADVGGQPSGTVLIGFDKDAFTSYRLDQSANAAVSEDGANAYRAALDSLLRDHSDRLGNAKAAHWFKEHVSPEDDPLPWLVQGEEVSPGQQRQAQARARELLRAIREGRRPDLSGNRFYAITLSGSGGRAMVRDWMEGGFEDLVRNIAQWFDDLVIAHRNGGNALAPDPKFMAVLGATVRNLDELAAPFVAAIWRVALTGAPIPRTALAQALARVRVDIISDAVPNHARMGLLKAYHVRRQEQEGDTGMAQVKPYLNEEHPSAAYQCGRLLAVLAGIQRAALGDVGAGVVQRYYAAASATPALVLGRIVRTAQFHLDKLESGGLKWWYESKLGEIMGRLKDAIPATLGLEEQSLFALGYYQQLVDLRTRKVIDDAPDASIQATEEGK